MDMDNAVKFSLHIAKEHNLLNHISYNIFIQLHSRTRSDLVSLSGASPVISPSENPLSCVPFVPIQS